MFAPFALSMVMVAVADIPSSSARSLSALIVRMVLALLPRLTAYIPSMSASSMSSPCHSESMASPLTLTMTVPTSGPNVPSARMATVLVSPSSMSMLDDAKETVGLVSPSLMTVTTRSGPAVTSP